ncbi:AAA family ATPase, partial [Micromonospora sp. NPDC003776]
MADVFADLVGQDEAVATLRRAAASAAALLRAAAAPAGPVPGGDDADDELAALAEEFDEPAAAPAEATSAGGEPGAGMTHAWIFTGPPGSGRSVAARAFAAALQCVHGTGCGSCPGCHTTMTGTHADVRLVVPEGLSISVKETRALVLRAASTPSGGRWQVVIIEDADRLGERASNALLKAIEEPSPRTVFLLCVPSIHPDDISVTIRSRCRVVPLRQPPARAVAGRPTWRVLVKIRRFSAAAFAAALLIPGLTA